MLKPYAAFLVAAVLFLAQPFSFAQDIHWNTGPAKGLVFKISNQEAQRLLTKDASNANFSKLLHTVVDTFDVKEGWIDRPAQGHFILATIKENKLNCDYTSVFPYQVFLLKEYDALAIQVSDYNGNVRKDAKVKFNLRHLNLDPETNTYRIENAWVASSNLVATVELDGFRSVFNIEKHDVPYWNNSYHRDEDPSFYSYMITDKNKYKPNEKVRFKSYALSQSRTPLHRDLEIWLTSYPKSIFLGKVAPHRPGSYASEFKLNDSLKLTLDKDYMLQLREKNGIIVSNCRFRYEDYELNGNQLDIKLAVAEQFRPASNELSITATDANGLILKDARATVLVKTQTIRETFQPFVILPDTLLFSRLDLDKEKPTTYSIPSSVFQKSNTVYDVIVTVLNSENKLLQQTVSAIHYYSQYDLTPSLSHDSVVYELFHNGVSVKNASAHLQFDQDTKVSEVRLPFKQKLNPATISVNIQTDSASRKFFLRDLNPRLELIGGIDQDSFKIALNNPQQLEVSWFIYQGELLLQKGFGTELDYRSGITDRSETYYVELLYSFGGDEQIKRKQYEFKEGFLNIALDIPDRIFPGQKIDASIQVTNSKGQAVNGVDLTALATSSKLGYNLPDLPYYGRTSMPRSQKATYSKDGIDNRNAVLYLDYEKWEKLLRLDTMRYYQFTYPRERVFENSSPISDRTQFAPYVMQNGNAKRIYVIEANGEPLYYSWVDQPESYSLYVQPSKKYQITLRLYDRVLVLDSLSFEAGKKTIVSIDLDHLPKTTKVKQFYDRFATKKNKKFKLHPEFTSTERSRYFNYIASFKRERGFGYLQSEVAFVPLFNYYSSDNHGSVLVGPITPGKLTYFATDSKISYNHSGGFSYTFEDNVVYKLNAVSFIPDQLSDHVYNPMQTINDLVTTKKEFLEGKPSLSKWRPRGLNLYDMNLRVKIYLPVEKDDSGIASFFFENCKTKQVLPMCMNPDGTTVQTIPRGCHNAIILYNNGTFLKIDNVNFRSNATALIDFNLSPLNPANTLSGQWLSGPLGHCFGSELKETTIRSFHRSHRSGNVRGVVYDEDGAPIPRVNIVVKGTTTGTVTDMEGKFFLDLDENPSMLVISFIGYRTLETELEIGAEASITLQADVQQLQEVLVVGYGSSAGSRDITSSTALLGSVAGLSITRREEANETKEAVPDTQTEEVKAAERNLYMQIRSLNQLRANFQDVAMWEPRLFTDKLGQTKFTITFPDDLTRWNAIVYAMNRNLQTGTLRKKIKSYKPIMAELQVPQFLTQGDSSVFLGKVLNYSMDKKITGKVKWDGVNTSFENDTQFDQFHTDLLPVSAATTDSITTSYRFTRDDGYMDGEKRSVPVVEQGIVRADGKLSILKNDDEINIKASKENVRIEILHSQLEFYDQELTALLNYKYDCNEQLASKLIGLIHNKAILKYVGKPFRHDKDVNKIITRLLKNQNEEFLWSWWDNSPATSYWMSAHILAALKTAQEAGYRVDLDIENVARKARYKFETLRKYELGDIELINSLASWQAKLNFRKIVHVLDSLVRVKHNEFARERQTTRGFVGYSLLPDKLLLLEIKQKMKLNYLRDSLLQYKVDGALGDVHFSDKIPARYQYDGDIRTNAIAYRIISRDTLLSEKKIPMQLYFLSARERTIWNTYDASSIIMSVLPDLIKEGASKDQPVSIKVIGKQNETITKFPFVLDLNPNEQITIHKNPGLPLYCMQYFKERVTVAKTGVKGFEIKTSLSDKGNFLEAGKPTTLDVEVTVTKEVTAQYVMIEIPLPGACSYADKHTNGWGVETHREYFKEKTIIFCENMGLGKHTFSVNLLPRFTGKYYVNPAQVSLMYVPVVNANTDMKTVKVK